MDEPDTRTSGEGISGNKCNLPDRKKRVEQETSGVSDNIYKYLLYWRTFIFTHSTPFSLVVITVNKVRKVCRKILGTDRCC